MSETRILIVEDETDVREMLVAQLKPLRFQIDEAANGRQAIEMAKQYHYDAVLSDLNMPTMSGLEMIGNLRAEGFYVPVIFLTGFGDKQKTVEALRHGATDFLDKPCDTKVLRAAITNAVEISHRMTELEREYEAILATLEGTQPEDLEKLKKLHRASLTLRFRVPLSDPKAS